MTTSQGPTHGAGRALLRECLLAWGVAVALVIPFYYVASQHRGPLIDKLFDILALPGWLLSLLFAPEGIHSDIDMWKLSAAANTLIYGTVIFISRWAYWKIRLRSSPC